MHAVKVRDIKAEKVESLGVPRAGKKAWDREGRLPRAGDSVS